VNVCVQTGKGRYGYRPMPGMLPVEGGVPLVYENDIVGAIGVSGVRSFEDGQIANAGAAAMQYAG
jgi:uncharacterized protein GlcG (DUF336 family)